MSLVPRERVEPRLGAYGCARAEALADPLLWGRAQEARRLLSSRKEAVAREELRVRLPQTDLHVTRKVDGEFTLLVVDGDEAFTVNPGGTVRVGLPLLEEARALAARAGRRRLQAVGELYLHDPSRRMHVHDVTSVLARPESAAELERVRFAAFDLLEPQAGTFGETWKNLTQILEGGQRVHAVEGGWVKRIEDVEERFRRWVEAEGGEGIVVRSDASLWKIKNRRTLDCVVIGFSEGVDDRKGLVHDLLIALVRDDGTFHLAGRVGTGFSEEERRLFRAELAGLAAPSDYTEVNADHLAYQMVRPSPAWIVEVSCVDLLAQTTRGGPIERMVLLWDGAWRIVRRLPLAGLIGPAFIRRRDDKQVNAQDLRLAQITDFVEVALADRDARSLALPRSELMKREVWTKVMKGQTMVRKLLLWKTNKEQSGEHPAYVLYMTDYSPNRREPLEREIRVGRTAEEMERHWAALEKEKIVKGWVRAPGAPATRT